MEDVILDGEDMVEVPKKETTKKAKGASTRKEFNEQVPLVNCLENRKVFVKYINRSGGLVTDPKHVLYGGLGINSKIRIVTPKLTNNVFKNVLTNNEKAYLEDILGINLSVYPKVDNYWANRGILIGKEGIILDLSNPEEFIDYKILLANSDLVCPSSEYLRKYGKKATYRFVIMTEFEDENAESDAFKVTARAFELYSEISTDLFKLATIYELITKRSLNRKNEKSVIAGINKVIKENPEAFVEVAEDEFLDTKVLIKKSVEIGSIIQRGQDYLLAEGRLPLAEGIKDPTLDNACIFLNKPKHQEIKHTLEALAEDI